MKIKLKLIKIVYVIVCSKEKTMTRKQIIKGIGMGRKSIIPMVRFHCKNKRYKYLIFNACFCKMLGEKNKYIIFENEPDENKLYIYASEIKEKNSYLLYRNKSIGTISANNILSQIDADVCGNGFVVMIEQNGFSIDLTKPME
jgi:hypothetical protein